MKILFVHTICLLLYTKVLVTEQQSCGSQKVVSYHQTDDQLRDNVLNPARGLYLDSLTSVKYFHPLKRNHLQCLRDNYATNLMLRMYSLDAFADGSQISSHFKMQLKHDLIAAKKAGWSVVLRFMYENNLDTQYNPQSEPTIAQIQEHIKDLAPTIAQFDGVVIAVQAGFHGEYGLWFTPGTNSTQQDASILKTLLQELPSTIPIQVVHPDYKTTIGQTTDRIGHYHECLLGGNVNNLKKAFPDFSTDASSLTYLMKDTETSVSGGKTCHPGDTLNPPRDLCLTSEKLFKDIHLTYLNGADPDETIKNYQRNGCLKSISNSLGYRLTLEMVSLPDEVNIHSTVCIGIILTNRGFAAPFRRYNVSIIITDSLNKSITYEAVIVTDTTKWLPGNPIKLLTSFNFPKSSVQDATYQVYLKIADAKQPDDTDYYILLSNSNLSPFTGLNRLGSFHITKNVTVKNGVFSPTTTLTPWKFPVVSTNPRLWTRVNRSCLSLPNGPPTTITVTNTAATAANTHLHTNTAIHSGTTTNKYQPYVTTAYPPPFVKFPTDTSTLGRCKKLDTVQALLQFSYFSHPDASECPNSTSKASPEAILMQFCNAPTNTIFWRPKGRVIDNCDKIPMYARVAVFSPLNYYDYDTTIRKAGVFLGCLKNGSKVTGVKIGMQLCGRPFDIENAHFSNEKDLEHLYVF